MIVVGVLGFVYKDKIRSFVEEIEAKTWSVNKPIILSFEFVLILIVLTGLAGVVISLRFILLGCPAPGC